MKEVQEMSKEEVISSQGSQLSLTATGEAGVRPILQMSQLRLSATSTGSEILHIPAQPLPTESAL